MTISVGQKIKMCAEKQRYTVMAANERFVIATKPFNARKTYLYTILDLERGVRGPCNLIFGLRDDVNTPQGAQEALAALMNKKDHFAVSDRHSVPITDEEFFQLTGKTLDTPSPTH